MFQIWYNIHIGIFLRNKNFFNLLEKYNFALENEQKVDILSLELLSDSIN